MFGIKMDSYARILSLTATSLVAGISGCTSSNSGATRSAASMVPEARDAASSKPFSADIKHLEEVERSSAWTVHMSDLALQRCTIKEVQETAQRIKERENSNITMFGKVRERMGLPLTPADHHADPRMESDEQLLSAASAEKAGELYIDRMIQERQTLIAFARNAGGGVTNPTLRAYLQSLSADSWKDISLLRDTRNRARTVPENSKAQLGMTSGSSASKSIVTVK